MKRNHRLRNYKHEKDNKITTYSFQAHEHFWKIQYNQYRLVLVRSQNRQYEIELRIILTKFQSNFIQKTIFLIVSSIAWQTSSTFMLIIRYFKFFQWFIMNERSLHKRNILIISKSDLIFKSMSRVEFNRIHAALNEFIKFLFQIFCIFYKV